MFVLSNEGMYLKNTAGDENADWGFRISLLFGGLWLREWRPGMAYSTCWLARGYYVGCYINQAYLKKPCPRIKPFAVCDPTPRYRNCRELTYDTSFWGQCICHNRGIPRGKQFPSRPNAPGIAGYQNFFQNHHLQERVTLSLKPVCLSSAIIHQTFSIWNIYYRGKRMPLFPNLAFMP